MVFDERILVDVVELEFVTNSLQIDRSRQECSRCNNPQVRVLAADIQLEAPIRWRGFVCTAWRKPCGSHSVKRSEIIF